MKSQQNNSKPNTKKGLKILISESQLKRLVPQLIIILENNNNKKLLKLINDL